MKFFLRYWRLLSYLGVHTELSYLELKRVYMVNIISMICVLPAFFFALINYFDDRLLLSGINCLNGICFATIIYLQYQHKHDIAKILLLCSSIILFFLGGLLYRNGGEYFLLSVLVVSMLLYDNIRALLIGGLLIITAILVIYAYPEVAHLDNPVPKNRAIYNISTSLLFILIAGIFFKHVIFHDKKNIEKQRQKLEAMNKEKEKIFSIIAHDVKSPLINTGIIIDIFESNTTDIAHVNDFIDQLKKQLNDQKNVLESILVWSSNKMEGISSPLTNINVYQIITTTLSDFRPHYTRKALSIIIDINPILEIIANYDQLIIIFRNLISNAIKFSHRDGNIYLYTTEDENSIYIHIKDEGIGIDNAKSEDLFQKVQQRSLGTSNEPGSGVGLVLCKELIELNKGSIQIKSALNEGSTFIVGFPKFKTTENLLDKRNQNYLTLEGEKSILKVKL